MWTEQRFRVGALLALLALAPCCSSCSGDHDATTDSGPGTDTDTGSEIEFGDTTPCVNEAQPGEVCIPGGNYLMGCVPGDTECEENEKPLVMTTLSPFFIDRKEATIAEVIPWLNDIKGGEGFTAYAGSLWWTDGTTGYLIWGAGWPVGNSSENVVLPIVFDGNQYGYDSAAENECPNQGGIGAASGGLSWLGAKMFCEWEGMQLPTEAQWEAAARGQTTNEFPCGSNLDDCWYGVYACCDETETCYDYYGTVCHCCAPFSSDHVDDCPSPFELNGMYGNAAEWTGDYISANHAVCATGCIDPQFPEEPHAGAVHVLKGGSMSSFQQKWMRVSYREELVNDNGSIVTGVRCVRSDTPFVPPDAGNDGGK